MPNRIIREGILDSEAVNALSFPAEVFYRRLMSVVDDFGRFDGRPSVLKGRLYTLKLDSVREADISRWTAECVKAGLIALYAADGKPYLLFRKLGSPRAKASRYPDPPAGYDADPPADSCDTIPDGLRADANMRAQTRADVPYSGSGSYSEDPPNPPKGGAAGLNGKTPPKRNKRGPTDAEADPLFVRFWEAYPRKVKKPAAAKAFASFNPTEDLLAVMLAAIAKQKRSVQWNKNDGEFIPHPASWLNDRRWEDQPPEKPKPAPRVPTGPPKDTPSSDLPPLTFNHRKEPPA